MADKYVTEIDPETGEEQLYWIDPHSGVKLLVREKPVHEQHREVDSHKEFFARENPKQKMRRYDGLQKRFEQLALDRADPGYVPGVEQITDTQFLDLRADPDFQALGQYLHKLTTKSGKQVRPVLKGEVGMRGATIYVLEGGYGEGNLVQVPDNLEKTDGARK